MFKNIAELGADPIWVKVDFKPQAWHVEMVNDDGEREVVSFVTRIVAEEVALETHGLYMLCDCPDRECVYV